VISRTRDFAKYRPKYWVCKVTRHEGAKVTKKREDCSHPSEEDMWREIDGSRKLESSQVESPTLGTPSHEVTRGASIKSIPRL
jgi:hypothetical protein